MNLKKRAFHLHWGKQDGEEGKRQRAWRRPEGLCPPAVMRASEQECGPTLTLWKPKTYLLDLSIAEPAFPTPSKVAYILLLGT